MSSKITKAIIPAAGFGTRFLPATKAVPKEMLPIVDKPVIQFVVEEAVASGITDIIIVTAGHKQAIEEHFGYPKDLERHLRETGKDKEAEEIRRIAELANFTFIPQQGPHGNGTPVLNSRSLIGDEPFAVLWGDEFIYAQPPRLQQMIKVWDKYGQPVISGVRVSPESVGNYGVASVTEVETGLFKIAEIVEKPSPQSSPSDLATHGAYIFTPRIFELLAETSPGRKGELWLVDAINKLAVEQDVYALEIKNAEYYDTGNKLEYLKTVVTFGLRHEAFKDEFRKFLDTVS